MIKKTIIGDIFDEARKNIRFTYNKNAIEKLIKDAHKKAKITLSNQLADELTRNAIMAKWQDIPKMNIVNFQKSGTPLADKYFLKENDINNFMKIIPCYTKGVLEFPLKKSSIHVNETSINIYEVTNLDLDNFSMELEVESYSKLKGIERLLPLMKIELEISVENSTLMVDRKIRNSMSTFLEDVNMRKCGWSKIDINYFISEVIPPYSKEIDRIELLIQLIARYFAEANLLLEKNKKVTKDVRKNTTTSVTKSEVTPISKKSEVTPISKESKEVTRNVRVINGVNFIQNNDEEPTIHKKRVAMQFHTNNWERRGYMRHYKNGKQVYIHPTTCSRGKGESEIKPTTLVVK